MVSFSLLLKFKPESSIPFELFQTAAASRIAFQWLCEQTPARCPCCARGAEFLASQVSEKALARLVRNSPEENFRRCGRFSRQAFPILPRTTRAAVSLRSRNAAWWRSRSALLPPPPGRRD